MKIGIAGGSGIEKEALDLLSGFPVLLVGSSYNPAVEKFNDPGCCEFYGEYLTPSYESMLSGCDVLIDLSENLKSKYLLSEIAAKYRKPFLTFFFHNGWKTLEHYDCRGCLSCYSLYQKPEPPFLLPEMPIESILDILKNFIDHPGKESRLLTLGGNREDLPLKSNDCPICAGRYSFLNNELSDVVSVSCGDNTVSVTPMNEVIISLPRWKEILPKENKITKENTFFLEFKTGNLSVILFRQGRMVVKNTKEKNTGLYLYRKYIGS